METGTIEFKCFSKKINVESFGLMVYGEREKQKISQKFFVTINERIIHGQQTVLDISLRTPIKIETLMFNFYR